MSPLRRGAARGASTSAREGGDIDEHVIRVAAPSAILVVEVEAVTRVFWTSSTAAEEDRIASWIMESPERTEAVTAAYRDRDAHGGFGRAAEWSRELSADPGGVVAGIERLLGDLR